jgi:hypothetical protein
VGEPISISRFQAVESQTLKIGGFAPGWSTFYAWNGSAATFTVK